MHENSLAQQPPEQHLNALSTAFCQQRSALVRKAQQITRCQLDAEDVVQEAFLRAISHLRDVRGMSREHLRCWLITVVRRAAIDRKRRARSQAILTPLTDALKPLPSCEPLALWNALDPSCIWEFVRQLQRTSSMRSTFALRFAHGLSYQQIANRLGVPTQTVGSRLNRAVRQLREAIMAGTAQSGALVQLASARSRFEQELHE